MIWILDKILNLQNIIRYNQQLKPGDYIQIWGIISNKTNIEPELYMSCTKPPVAVI